MREGCRRILSSEGYHVDTAVDGVDALTKFQVPGDFDVVISDLKMPRMGGMELIEALHAIDDDALLLVITAYATIDTAVDATKRGAYGYIPKPFTPDELLLHVRNGLEKRSLRIEAKQLREERERRLLEVAFERSKSTTILNCMTDGVLVANRQGQIVLRNQALARILPEFGDLPLPATLDSLGNRDLVALVKEVVEAAGPVIASKEIELTPSTYMVNAAPVLEPGGEALGAVAVLRDITALKKLEIAKSMFVSMVAHELKSPLATIESSLDIVLSGIAGSDPARDRQMMRRALLRATTLRTLVGDLLNLTAIETGNFLLKRTPTDLCKVVRDVVDTYADKASEKGLTLELECDQTALRDCRVLGDCNALTSIVGNLLDNAVKYTPEGGTVTVTVDRTGLYARVRVKDSGIGMTPGERDKVFDEFYRIKNETTAGIPGTGLGLTLVRRLVDLHQGRIEVDSTPGLGSQFSVSLPTATYSP
jgi:signal transduction histidine kinase